MSIKDEIISEILKGTDYNDILKQVSDAKRAAEIKIEEEKKRQEEREEKEAVLESRREDLAYALLDYLYELGFEPLEDDEFFEETAQKIIKELKAQENVKLAFFKRFFLY